MLVAARQGTPQEIPDPSSVLPYIGLYTMVHLKPDELVDVEMPTVRFPNLSILSNGQWIPASANTSPSAPNAALIFDATAVATTPGPGRPANIPLSANQPDYFHKRYWRLPSSAFGGILSAIMLRVVNSPSNAYDELRLARNLFNYLSLQKDELEVPETSDSAGPGGPGGPSGSEPGAPGTDKSVSLHGGGRPRRSTWEK